MPINVCIIMKIKKLSLFIGLCVFVMLLMLNTDLAAQCPMCKLSAESNLRDGGSQGRGLNNGILYMFIMPYILVGTLAFLWIKNRKNYDTEN
jgi:hypothetical protein